MSKSTTQKYKPISNEITFEVHDYLSRCSLLREKLEIPPNTTLEPYLLGMGEHNINFKINMPDERKFVLRVNVATQPFHDNQILYEYNALRAAYPSGCIPEPLFVDYSPDAPGLGILVESFCEGKQLNFDSLRPGDVQCAVQMMADVHSVIPSSNRCLFQPKDPLEDMFTECVQRFQTYLRSGFEDERVTKWTQLFIDTTKQMLETLKPPQDTTHIINTETLPSHFLIPKAAAASAANAPSSGRFCDHPGHFVDWERAILGEVAQDIAYFVSPTTTYWDSEFFFPPSDISGVLNDYWQAVDGRFAPQDFEERFFAWRMMTALRSTTWCVRAIPKYLLAANCHTDENTNARKTKTVNDRIMYSPENHTTKKTARKLPVYLSDEFMEHIATECFGL